MKTWVSVAKLGAMPEVSRVAPKFDVTIDRSSPVPLYHQLAQALEDAIKTGVLKPGDRLENELSLTRRLGVARPTARQAIEQLVKKGLLVRKRGVGTQVVHSPINRNAKLTSLYDDLQLLGKKPTTQVLEISMGTLDPEVASAVGPEVDLTEDFLHIKRLRCSDDIPLAILTNFVPARYALSEEDLGHRGLYECLRSRGVNLRIAHQTIGCRLMTDEEAQLLGEEPPAACLTVERTAYDDTGHLVELGQHIYRGSLYKIQTFLAG